MAEFTSDRRLCRAAALEQGLLARLGPLLRAFAELRGHFDLGFRSLDAYTRERLGTSPRKVRALMRLERALGVTVRRLEDDVDHALASGAFDPALLPALPEGVRIGARPMPAEPNDTWVANVPTDVARLFRACHYSVARHLNASPAAALEAMFDHCIDTWRCPTPRARRADLELPLGRFRGDRTLPG